RIMLVALASSSVHCSGSPGAASDGGSMAPRNDAGPDQVMQVLDCNGLAAAGVFEEITPPALLADPENGPFAITADPTRHGVVWLRSDNNRIYRSYGCRAAWVRGTA